MGPLGKGFLTGQLSDALKIDDKDFRQGLPRFQEEAMKANLAVVVLIKEISVQKNATPAQVALVWLLARKPRIVPISGTTKARFEENIAAVNLKLISEEVEHIDKVSTLINFVGGQYSDEMLKKIAL